MHEDLEGIIEAIMDLARHIDDAERKRRADRSRRAATYARFAQSTAGSRRGTP